MGLLNNLGRNTLAALTAIDEGRVRWSGSGAGRISFYAERRLGDPEDAPSINFNKLSERFYERSHWDVATSGPVHLTVAGKVELEYLKTEFET